MIANIFSPDPRPGQERPAANLPADVEQAVRGLTKDKQSLIRGEALRLLGETKDKKYADLFLAGLNDQSYFVVDESATALGSVGGSASVRRVG